MSLSFGDQCYLWTKIDIGLYEQNDDKINAIYAQKCTQKQ